MYSLYYDGFLCPETIYPLIDRPQCEVYVGKVHRYPLSSAEES